jgi:hypothetical protein
MLEQELSGPEMPPTAAIEAEYEGFREQQQIEEWGQSLEEQLSMAESREAYHATQQKRFAKLAKVTAGALKILREGDSE